MPDSPGGLVGLRKFDDYILGSEKQTFHSTEAFVCVCLCVGVCYGVTSCRVVALCLSGCLSSQRALGFHSRVCCICGRLYAAAISKFEDLLKRFIAQTVVLYVYRVSTDSVRPVAVIPHASWPGECPVTAGFVSVSCDCRCRLPDTRGS